MFSTEVKINGVFIGYLYGHNIGRVDAEGNYAYEYQWYTPEGGGGSLTKGAVVYKRESGMEGLLSSIFKDIQKSYNIC